MPWTSSTTSSNVVIMISNCTATTGAYTAVSAAHMMTLSSGTGCGYNRAADEARVRALERGMQERVRDANGWTPGEWQRQKIRAEARAESLLLKFLTETQRQTYFRKGYFEVRPASERRYRVRRGQFRNVLEIAPDGRPLTQFCLHPVEWVPAADAMLAQKCLLETGEERFRKAANRSEPAVFWC